jgi:hypothetical protein
MPLYPSKCYELGSVPNFSLFRCFLLGLTFESLEELGVRHLVSELWESSIHLLESPMAPKKTRKLVQETMVEEPTLDLDGSPEAIREEEQKDSEDERNRDDHNDHESEEEQPTTIHFTP